MLEDRKILDLKEAKYKLESFTYEMKNGIDQYGNYEHFIDPAMRQTFLENLLATEAWIYAEGENAPLSEQRGRLEALESIGRPIKSRWIFRQEFPDYVNIYQKTESQFTARMSETPHLTQENRQAIEEKCAQMQQFYMELQQELETCPRYVDPSCTLAQIEKKQMLFEAEVNAILNKPPPAPKKEDEKKDGSGEGKAKSAADDAEMNDEGAA